MVPGRNMIGRSNGAGVAYASSSSSALSLGQVLCHFFSCTSTGSIHTYTLNCIQKMEVLVPCRCIRKML
jgi:hypothetical protein